MPKLSFLSARAFDPGLAALAALSAGFVAFAMPQPLFSGLIEASRLPDYVAAAQPPLGDTARLAAAGTTALITFAAVWALMAALGRIPFRAARPEAAPAAAAPRLRRADAHPDAPARRPLLARDLGEPLDLEDFPSDRDPRPEPAGPGHRPLPAFLVPQEPESAPVGEAGAEPEVGAFQPDQAASEPDWTPSAPDWAEDEAEPEAEPLPISELAAQLPETREDEEEAAQPLSQLVNRIEFGLSRKRQALPAAELPAAREEIEEQPENVGHRLRSAIADLQKIASTGN